MYTSLALMEAADVSRATLNNYIAMGLIPRPEIKKPDAQSKSQARQIGYFPSETLARIQKIQQLKKDGKSMAEITIQLQSQGFGADSRAIPSRSDVSSGNVGQDGIEQPTKVPALVSTGKLHLTIDQIPYPAYMVNYNFEIVWHNEMAKQDLLGNFERLPADIKERNALAYLFKGELGHSPVNRESIIQFHLTLSKGRLTRDDLLSLLPGKLGGTDDAAERKTKFTEAYPSGAMMQLPLSLFGLDGIMVNYCVYASYYREGILFVYVPGTAGCDSLLGLLERRDEVIRNLLKKRLPVLTDVAVLVADLQSSTRICTELPPEEYFELINQIWATMEPIFRKYYGTHGKHVGDGMVHYFFPQPDCNYIFNALICAYEIKAAMRRISKEWQLRKNWLNELYLNTAVNEGQEWLGLFHAETKVEFTMLGDTINHAARLSDYARSGSIWATKNFLGKLSADERQRVSYGIHRKNQEGLEVLINSSYSRISELLDLSIPKHDKLRDISALPVTEILDIRPDSK
jgi:adenylate cyclase